MSKSRPLVYPRLKARMAELDLTNVEVAARAEVHPGTVSQIMRGRLEPSERLRRRLAEVLDSTVEELFAAAEVAA